MNPVRRASRLLVLDPENRVLLFQYKDGRRKWWATPGGGLERGETFEEAATREAAEELSLSLPRHSRLFGANRGQPIRQIERYFLIRLSEGEVGVREVHLREGIIAARWWSLEERDSLGLPP